MLRSGVMQCWITFGSSERVELLFMSDRNVENHMCCCLHRYRLHLVVIFPEYLNLSNKKIAICCSCVDTMSPSKMTILCCIDFFPSKKLKPLKLILQVSQLLVI